MLPLRCLGEGSTLPPVFVNSSKYMWLREFWCASQRFASKSASQLRGHCGYRCVSIRSSRSGFTCAFCLSPLHCFCKFVQINIVMSLVFSCCSTGNEEARSRGGLVFVPILRIADTKI